MTPLLKRPTELSMFDGYCGAGGSSTGAAAVGVPVKVAVNHWDLAIETHNTNHPDTDHDKADINKADPGRYPRTTIGWFSPECTYWSSARGEKLPDGQGAWDFFGDMVPNEAADRSRMGMWDVPRFAAHHVYDIVIVENVPRVVKGIYWERWLVSMHDLGYRHEVIWLNSMHAQMLGPGAPQSRDRVYIVFWRAGNPRPAFEKWLRPAAICPEHGLIQSRQVIKPGGAKMKTYKAQYTLRCPDPRCNVEVFPAVAGADTIIDWSRRGIRIGDREKHGMKPLEKKTLLRTFHGVKRHWSRPVVVEAAGNTYDAADPRHPQHADPDAYYRAWDVSDPLRTLHTTSSKGLIVRGEGNETPGRPVELPIGALTAAGSQFLAAPPLVMRNMTARGDQGQMSKPADEPIGALTASSSHSLVVPYRNGMKPRPAGDPLPTMTTVDGAALLVPTGGTWREDATPTDRPMPARTTRETDALVVPLRTNGTAAPASDPLKTVVAGTVSQSLVVPLRNHGVAKPTGYPIDTVAASGNHHALLMRNNGDPSETAWQTTPVDEPMRTLTTAGHQSLIDGPEAIVLAPLTDAEIWQMVYDAEFRMLEPDEVKRGMAFPSSYILLGNKREQVRLAGNAVTPNAARDLIAACIESLGYDVAEQMALAA